VRIPQCRQGPPHLPTPRRGSLPLPPEGRRGAIVPVSRNAAPRRAGAAAPSTLNRAHLLRLFYQVEIRPHSPPARAIRTLPRPQGCASEARPPPPRTSPRYASTSARATHPRRPFTAASAERSQAARPKRPPRSPRANPTGPPPAASAANQQQKFLPGATPARSRTTRTPPRYDMILSILRSPRPAATASARFGLGQGVCYLERMSTSGTVAGEICLHHVLPVSGPR
jgi:hypothetical protein